MDHERGTYFTKTCNVMINIYFKLNLNLRNGCNKMQQK